MRPTRGASAPKAEVHPADAALDALARELAPRVAKLLREQASANDGNDALTELLSRAGYELENETTADAPVKP